MTKTRVRPTTYASSSAAASSGWRARGARRSAACRVLVLERDRPARAPRGVAAGMLAPVTEAEFGEEALLELNLAAAERWPAFAAELEAALGLTAGYRADGRARASPPTATTPRSFAACTDFQRVARPRRRVARRRATAARSSRACRRACAAAIHAPHDHQVDPARRARAAAGLRAARAASCSSTCEVAGLVRGRRTRDGVARRPRRVARRAGGGRRRRWSRALALPERAARAPGQGPDPDAARAARRSAARRRASCARRAATCSTRERRPRGDRRDRRGARLRRDRDRRRRLPAARGGLGGAARRGRARVVEARAGLRPGTPDNAARGRARAGKRARLGHGPLPQRRPARPAHRPDASPSCSRGTEPPRGARARALLDGEGGR